MKYSILFPVAFIMVLSFITGCPKKANREESLSVPKLSRSVRIKYNLYIEPGYTPRPGLSADKIMEQTEMLQRETGIELIPKVQFYAPVGQNDKNMAAFEFVKNVRESVAAGEPPDLLYTDNLWAVNQLKTLELLSPTTELITQYAPFIRDAFPEDYWDERDRFGEGCGIPVKGYTPADMYGFWVIEKDFLNRNDLSPPGTPDELLEVLSRCGSTEGVPSREWQQKCSDLAVFISEDKKADQMTYFISLFGIEPIGGREIIFDLRTHQFLKADEYTRAAEALEFVFSRTLLQLRAEILHIRLTPWTVLHIPYGIRFRNPSQLEKDKLREILNSDDYVIIHDTELLQYDTFDRYHRFYIPAASTKAKDTIEAVNLLASTDLINTYFGRYLGPLYDSSKLQPSELFPLGVKEECNQFFNRLKTSSIRFFDAEYVYKQILIKQRYMVPGMELTETQYIGYPRRIAGNYILQAAENSEDTRNFLAPYRLQVETVRSKMQEQFNQYKGR
jgi:hypothetical protein